jgi:hypothetical protein
MVLQMHQSKQSYTPRLAPPLDVISSSSVGTKISLLHHADHSPTAVAEQDPNESISNLGTRARRHSIAQPPFKASGGFSRREPAQVQLIRRVRAVVDFPVKEEEDDDGGMGVESAGIFTPGSYVPASSVPVASTASPTSASEEEQAPERRAPRRSGVAHTVTRSGRAVHQSPWMPTDGTAGGGEAHYGDTSPEEDNDGAVGEEFTEAKAREHLAKKRKKTPRRAVAPAVDPLYMDEDDDELTIGAEVRIVICSRHELWIFNLFFRKTITSYMALNVLMADLLAVPDHANQRGNHQQLRRLERRGKRLLILNPENVRRRVIKQSDGWKYDTLCDGCVAFLAFFLHGHYPYVAECLYTFPVGTIPMMCMPCS